jgi:hypothetical protein
MPTWAIGANNRSTTAKEVPKIFAIHHFEVMCLNEIVKIDVGFGKCAC